MLNRLYVIVYVEAWDEKLYFRDKFWWRDSASEKFRNFPQEKNMDELKDPELTPLLNANLKHYLQKQAAVLRKIERKHEIYQKFGNTLTKKLLEA